MMDNRSDSSGTPGTPEHGISSGQTTLELLAPAGDEAALEAALKAGADAVYFGLTVLNARRRAKNFTQQQLAQAVRDVHEHGARAYLTLNIDLAERELELAAQVLELARRVRCDAVLVRDPALLQLRPVFPELEFHFSTQTCMSNSADVAAAARWGADRVVLAREMTLSEIAAASTATDVKTEVFVQGALCFSISGRCLMSSWIGGRSGNRGSCASPCRVPWQANDDAGHDASMAMHDLAAIERLGDLQRAGVTAVKIEGRMKNADWVSRAVGLYQQALHGDETTDLRGAMDELGAYTGRRMTCGYLDGQRGDLTGHAGRRSPLHSATLSFPKIPQWESTPSPPESDRSSFDLEITVEPRGIEIRCECEGTSDAWTIPKTVVHRPHKARSIGAVLDRLSIGPLHGCQLRRAVANDPEFLLVPRAVNALLCRIANTVQRAQKKRFELTGIELPEAVSQAIKKPNRCTGNRTILGDPPDRVRLEAGDVATFLSVERPQGVIVEGVTADNLRDIRSLCGRIHLVLALPPVFFEDDIDRLKALLRSGARLGVVVEVNSWGGWWLARQAGVKMESGPGLPVLNSLAASTLARAGIRAVTLSVEADRRQFKEVTANCPIPCSLIVFGRPPLMISRVEMDPSSHDNTLVDRRNNQVVVRREHGLCVVRPITPFDLRTIHNERICVKHLVVDLVGSPDPVKDWRRIPGRNKDLFKFNYERGLS
ncbi:MAG: U32 family peptidase [Pirellulales bacterium]